MLSGNRRLRWVPNINRRVWLITVAMVTGFAMLSIRDGGVCLVDERKDAIQLGMFNQNTKIKEPWFEAIRLGGRPKPYKVSLTIGIPTVKREKGSYLFSTLQSLINASTEKERENTIVVISVNDRDQQFQTRLMVELRAQFAPFLETGFLQVITAPPAYYPPLSSLKMTFGDSKDRVRWRSKQNLDYAFLIHYSQNLSKYYLQLEDDVIASPGFIAKMTSYIADRKDDWTMIDFSVLGFIGKLYKNSDLSKLANLLRSFFNEQPCDFLLIQFLSLMLQKNRHIRIPTLFKHVGYHSSLHNQTRDANDVYFEGETKFYKGDNPEAKLHTTMSIYENNTIDKAYSSASDGGFFWGRTPKSGDTISISFKQPQTILRIVITTGLFQGQKDRMHSAFLISGKRVKGEPILCQEEAVLGSFINGTLEFTGHQDADLDEQCDANEAVLEMIMLTEEKIGHVPRNSKRPHQT